MDTACYEAVAAVFEQSYQKKVDAFNKEWAREKEELTARLKEQERLTEDARTEVAAIVLASHATEVELGRVALERDDLKVKYSNVLHKVMQFKLAQFQTMQKLFPDVAATPTEPVIEQAPAPAPAPTPAATPVPATPKRKMKHHHIHAEILKRQKTYKQVWENGKDEIPPKWTLDQYGKVRKTEVDGYLTKCIVDGCNKYVRCNAYDPSNPKNVFMMSNFRTHLWKYHKIDGYN